MFLSLEPITGAIPMPKPYLGQTFFDVYHIFVFQFGAMTEWLLQNKLFLIGLVIFVIGACIALVKRVIR